MDALKGNNLIIFTGRDMDVIGCENSATIEVVEQEVITTTKGTGRGTSREPGRYDATLTSNGVVFLANTEAASASDNKTDSTFLLGYMLKGKKVAAKVTMTAGSTTKFLFANWVISSITLTGNAGELATYAITMKIDGELYPSANIEGNGSFDGAEMLRYVHSGGAADGFTSVTLEDASKIYFLVLNGVVYDGASIQTLALATDLPTGTGTIGFHAPSGTINFEAGLVNGDIIYVSFDVAD